MLQGQYIHSYENVYMASLFPRYREVACNNYWHQQYLLWSGLIMSLLFLPLTWHWLKMMVIRNSWHFIVSKGILLNLVFLDDKRHNTAMQCALKSSEWIMLSREIIIHWLNVFAWQVFNRMLPREKYEPTIIITKISDNSTKMFMWN